jgi:hypothetical protein
VRNIAVRANQNPRPVGRDELCRVMTTQMIEEPAAIGEPTIWHVIARVKATERNARGQWAGSVMQGELVRCIAALERSGLVQAFAQAKHRRGDWETFGLIGIEQRIGSAAGDVCKLPAQVVGILYSRVESLASCRRMRVRRIPCQEHTPNAVAIHDAYRRLVDRTPRYTLDAMARDFAHRALNARSHSPR